MPVPSWLRRWAALVAQFIEEEARELPKLLQAPQSAGRRGPGRWGRGPSGGGVWRLHGRLPLGHACTLLTLLTLSKA